jgi:hypothetical protein
MTSYYVNLSLYSLKCKKQNLMRQKTAHIVTINKLILKNYNDESYDTVRGLRTLPLEGVPKVRTYGAFCKLCSYRTNNT